MSTFNAGNASRGVSLPEAANNIVAMGHIFTYVYEGDMGSGKSALLDMVGDSLPNHKKFYFDCTTKMDSGDVMIPKMKELDGNDFVRFAINEELGAHLSGPIAVMLDEIGKGNDSLKNALLRFMYERKIGNNELHPESIVFATTNLGAEGVGDILPPHARNRVCVSRLLKPTAIEWIEWGYYNNIDPTVLAWVNDNPKALQSFTEVEDPRENEMIYHPQQQRLAFVTPRSLERASVIISNKDRITSRSLKDNLIGTIGAPAAASLLSHLRFASQLPSLDEIKNDPMNAKIPTDSAAMCLLVFRTLSQIERNWVPQWMKYLTRLSSEAVALFAMQVIRDTYKHRSMVMTCPDFMKWAVDNKHLTSADI